MSSHEVFLLVRVNGVHPDPFLLVHRPAVGTACRQTLLCCILPDSMPTPQAHAVSAGAELTGQVCNVKGLQTQGARFSLMGVGHVFRQVADKCYPK